MHLQHYSAVYFLKIGHGALNSVRLRHRQAFLSASILWKDKNKFDRLPYCLALFLKDRKWAHSDA